MNFQFRFPDDTLPSKRSREQIQNKTKGKSRDTVDKQIENTKRGQDKEVLSTEENGMQETIEENRKRLAKELERIRLNRAKEIKHNQSEEFPEDKIALRSKDNRTEKSIHKA